MFRQFGIYSSVGLLYEPVDKDQVMFYKEDKKGQILEEGINEAGAMSSFIAAGTSYSSHNQPMLPFYIFYSMFGFQRIGDLAWAAGDSRRSEEHTSELQSLMRTSYAIFCSKIKSKDHRMNTTT